MSKRRDRKARIEALGSLSILRHCDERELAMVIDAATDRDVAAGAHLCHAGDPADGAMIIVSGDVDVVRSGEVVDTLGAGDVAGELGPLGAKARNED